MKYLVQSCSGNLLRSISLLVSLQAGMSTQVHLKARIPWVPTDRNGFVFSPERFRQGQQQCVCSQSSKEKHTLPETHTNCVFLECCWVLWLGCCLIILKQSPGVSPGTLPNLWCWQTGVWKVCTQPWAHCVCYCESCYSFSLFAANVCTGTLEKEK